MQEASDKNIENLLAGGGFSSLLQNPEIASKLPRIMEALAPVMAEMKAEKSEASGSVKPSAEDAADGGESAAAQTPPGENKAFRMSRRLRPDCSPRRRRWKTYASGGFPGAARS